jgi:hypothetical protein
MRRERRKRRRRRRRNNNNNLGTDPRAGQTLRTVMVYLTMAFCSLTPAYYSPEIWLALPFVL